MQCHWVIVHREKVIYDDCEVNTGQKDVATEKDKDRKMWQRGKGQKFVAKGKDEVNTGQKFVAKGKDEVNTGKHRTGKCGNKGKTSKQRQGASGAVEAAPRVLAGHPLGSLTFCESYELQNIRGKTNTAMRFEGVHVSPSLAEKPMDSQIAAHVETLRHQLQVLGGREFPVRCSTRTYQDLAFVVIGSGCFSGWARHG
ncbi:hypothetical protein FIBSPDRAFT_896342 [Athelia psychrophila]|uniref:Uncharacterized protein n=1 Tax=Athelia psychrophila TaxID=1759441 RepID=A0A166DH65_9AGAM|nr:hypothetical protein FIBSPDRAFT_896342 [Fibularhizoctonia sp. CBS 109695]